MVLYIITKNKEMIKMTKKEIIDIIEKREYEFYGLRALTKENVEQIEKGEDLANSVVYCDDYSYDESPVLNGVSTIEIEYYWDLEENLEEALKLVKNYENNGIVLIGGNDRDDYSYDDKEIVITNPVIIGYVGI